MDIALTVAFIGLMIVALTQLVTYLLARAWKSAFTIIIAMFVGVLVSLLAPVLGLPNITIGQSLVAALDFVGIHTLARTVAGK